MEECTSANNCPLKQHLPSEKCLDRRAELLQGRAVIFQLVVATTFKLQASDGTKFLLELVAWTSNKRRLKKTPVKITEESTQSSCLLLQRLVRQFKAKWAFDLWCATFGFGRSLGLRIGGAACRQVNIVWNEL